MKGKIVQIMPAGDWVAVYLIEEEPWYQTEGIAVWALVENTDKWGEVEQNIVGFSDADGYLDSVEGTSNFHQYVCRADIDDEWRKNWTTEAQNRRAQKLVKGRG